MLLLKYRTVTIKFSILWCVKRSKNRKTNVYHYDVNNVVPEIVIKGTGNVTTKYLFLSCFYSRFEKPVFRFLPFSELKIKKKRKEKKRDLPLFQLILRFAVFANVCFHYTDLFLADTKYYPKEWYNGIYTNG